VIIGTLDFDQDKSSVLFVVITPDNLKRLKQADPITLESQKRGGMLTFKYGNNLSILVAYEEDEEAMKAMAAKSPIEFLAYLERGRTWNPSEDGKENVIPIAGKSAEPRH
jgi:hypothetical protein